MFGVEIHSSTVVGYATIPVFVEASKKKKMMKSRAYLAAGLYLCGTEGLYYRWVTGNVTLNRCYFSLLYPNSVIFSLSVNLMVPALYKVEKPESLWSWSCCMVAYAVDTSDDILVPLLMFWPLISWYRLVSVQFLSIFYRKQGVVLIAANLLMLEVWFLWMETVSLDFCLHEAG